MKRRWNIALWAGFLVVLAAGATFLPLSARWPTLAHWISLLLFLGGLSAIAAGLARAWRDPALYRGRIAGPILMVVALLITGFFSYGTFYVARRMPSSPGAPQVGQKAPDFTLVDQEGRVVSLSGLLAGGERGPAAAVLLIFYRGYW